MDTGRSATDASSRDERGVGEHACAASPDVMQRIEMAVRSTNSNQHAGVSALRLSRSPEGRRGGGAIEVKAELMQTAT